LQKLTCISLINGATLVCYEGGIYSRCCNVFVRFVDTDVFTNVMSGPVERAVLSADLGRFVYTYAARNFKHTCQFSWVPHINNHFDTIRQTAEIILTVHFV